MNRLLQGDVGTGKTVVALATALIHIASGKQVALMAPTEILAQQHYATISHLMPSSVRCALLTGSTTGAQREALYAGLAGGDLDLVVGTHALIEDSVSFRNLGYIIIDEQHRFGVEQRAQLRTKGNDTDLLVMTATPIPRSLSMTVFGDMDISSIKSRPADRQSVKTLSFPESRLPGVYNSLEKYISQGRQIFYVLPLIEDSEKVDLKSAVAVYEKLRGTIFTHRSVALLHGRMKQKEKDDVMTRFRNREIDILVSTTVIEVGIDVPNASVIVIEHAERFGLSQLHQLRGRVGRGEYISFCVLIHPDNISEESRKRIDLMVSTDDGFSIAEEDLKIRGAGEFTGSRQHGMSEFEFTDLAGDIDIITAARDEARAAVSGIQDIKKAVDECNSCTYNGLISGIRTKRILEILS
jgi:ATP-dependent DNA helicase RecG